MDFNELHRIYASFFHDYKQELGKSDGIAYMAIDGEWYTRGGKNIVLSYQIATCCQNKTRNIIEYMPYNQRLKLHEIIELGLKSVSFDVGNFMGRIMVVLISHNTTAEWSILDDRDEAYIIEKLTAVRNSPVTGWKGIEIIAFENIPVEVKLFDTMLLAPASHRSLKKLSSLLGSFEKESITQYYIEHMDEYLRDHPDQYLQYALRDTEVTLALFFLLQTNLNKLTGGAPKLFKTLASAGVKSFTGLAPWFHKYKTGLKKKKPPAYQLVKRSYYGGRNESYFVGWTSDYPETRDKIWVDIDFTGCYPTTMSLVGKIDLEAEVDYIPRRYEMDIKTEKELLADNVPQEILNKVKKALTGSVNDFERTISSIDKKNCFKIREAVSVYDNRLIKSWYSRWQNAVAKNDFSEIESASIAGFARVAFKFPDDCEFPSLPVRHNQYGLLYPLEGETVVSAAEIILALDAGAEIQAITSVEFPLTVYPSDTEEDLHQPYRFTMEHLSTLARDRKSYQKQASEAPEAKGAEVMQRLLKEFTNSLYGKFAQGINPRQIGNTATGEMERLPPSEITEPCTASLITSLARAALSATLVAIERYNKGKSRSDEITVVSVTTDGLLIGIPTKQGYSVTQDYFEDRGGLPHLIPPDLNRLLADFGHTELLNEIEKFLAIKQMRYARSQLTGNSEIFEIKHLADEILSLKTRGQIGKVVTGHVTLLARCNLKPPLREIYDDDPEKFKELVTTGDIPKATEEARWIEEQIALSLEDNKIRTYQSTSLNKFKRIVESKGELDLTENASIHKINSDFDWKRKMVVEGDSVSPFTVPHKSRNEMVVFRNALEAIRKTGSIALPKEVINRVQNRGKVTRTTGGTPRAVARLFLRGMLQEKFGEIGKLEPYKDISNKLNNVWKQHNHQDLWSIQSIKDSKRGKWEPGTIASNHQLVTLVEDLAKVFNLDPTSVKDSIFSAETFRSINSTLIRYVISAVLDSPRWSIEPFYQLHCKGVLPGRSQLEGTFSGQITTEKFIEYCSESFIPGALDPKYQDQLKRLFIIIGLTGKQAESCAKCIAPRVSKPFKDRRNPTEKQCVDQFVMAITQGDYGGKASKAFIMGKLRRYKLSEKRCVQLMDSRFNPNSLSDTPSNRKQLQEMAKIFGYDPEPLKAAILAIKE